MLTSAMLARRRRAFPLVYPERSLRRACPACPDLVGERSLGSATRHLPSRLGASRSSTSRFPALHRSPVTASPISFPFCFLRTLLRFFALSENSTLFFSSDSALFAQNNRGCGRGTFLRIRRGMRTPRSAAPRGLSDFVPQIVLTPSNRGLSLRTCHRPPVTRHLRIA